MSNRRLRRLHTAILAQFDRLVDLAGNDGKARAKAPSVSGWSVAQHLDHLTQVDRNILRSLSEMLEKQDDGQGGPTFLGRMVLTLGKIPRGRGKAPKGTEPRERSGAELAADIEAQQAAVEALGARLQEVGNCGATFPHPYFGPLTPARWLRFIDIHHRHHLSIIDDVLAQG